MMTIEALASLSTAVLIASVMLLASASEKGAGTSLYEQQLCQDAAEVIWMSGLAEKYGGYLAGDAGAGEEAEAGLTEIQEKIGWCVGLELEKEKPDGDKRAITGCGENGGDGRAGRKIVVSRTLVLGDGFEKVLVSIEKR